MSVERISFLKGATIPILGAFRSIVSVGLLGALALLPGALEGQDAGVFLRVADLMDGTVPEVSSEVEAAVAGAGWKLLAAYDVGVDGDACSYQARVLVVDWPEHTEVVMSKGSHGAYAAPFKISVFEDELGVHVAAVNPRSIYRTVVAEEGMDGEWVRLSAILRRTLAEGIGAESVVADYGQFRDKGRIGRTMGVMAGGSFLEKFKLIEDVEEATGGAEGVAQAVFEAMTAAGPGPEWGIRPIYVMNPAPGVAVLGVTGERLESQSFSIVGRGSDKGRSDFACPGIDHAAAYPIEVVFTEADGRVQIHLVEAMFRMKMFFEDAGKMSFARNMGMPGSIEDEIKDLIRAALF
jgi:uncharacterized protein (DUF302 family)